MEKCFLSTPPSTRHSALLAVVHSGPFIHPTGLSQRHDSNIVHCGHQSFALSQYTQAPFLALLQSSICVDFRSAQNFPTGLVNSVRNFSTSLNKDTRKFADILNIFDVAVHWLLKVVETLLPNFSSISVDHY
jgi:hypothetical protein